MRKGIAAIGITTSLLLLALYFSSSKTTALNPATPSTASAMAELDQAQRRANLPQENEPKNEEDTQDDDLIDSLSEELLGESPPSQTPSQEAQNGNEAAPTEAGPAAPAQTGDSVQDPKKVSPEKFNQKAQAFLNQMAARSHRPDKTPNGHDAPKHVVASALMLRDLAEKVSDNPELEPVAIPIYRRCAEGSGHPGSVRALCYFQLKELAPEQATEIGPRLAGDVAEMSELL